MTRISICLLFCLLLLTFFSAGPAAQGGASATQEELALGEKLYNAHCRSCHLPGGKSRIKKLNLSDENWMHGGSLEEIEQTIAEGIEGSQMQPFKSRLQPNQVTALAKYVLSFGAATSTDSQ